MDKAILPQNPDDFNALAAVHGWETICDGSLAFEEPELIALHKMWQRIKGIRPMPSRQEMTPRVLKDWLPHISVYERVQSTGTSRRYRIRLLGTAYQPVWGDLDLTGRFLDEALPQEHLPLLETVLDTVLAHRGPLRFLTHSVVTGRTYLIAEFFSAALTDAEGEANFILSAGYFAPGNWDEVARRYWEQQRPPRA